MSPSSNGHRHRVVITGIGAVSPNGIGAEAFASACLAGKSGLVRVGGVDLSKIKSTIAAQIVGFDPLSALGSVDVRRVPRMVHLAMAASKEAIESARLNIDAADIELQRKIGVSLGTGGGGLAFVEDQYKTFFTTAPAHSFPSLAARMETFPASFRLACICAGRRTCFRPAVPAAPMRLATR